MGNEYNSWLLIRTHSCEMWEWMLRSSQLLPQTRQSSGVFFTFGVSMVKAIK